MLVSGGEGVEYSLQYLGEWNSMNIRKGMILEVLLCEGDPSYPPDLWAGFLTLEVFVNMSSDGTQEVRAKSLLVGGLEHFLFSHILGIIIPID